MASCSLSSSSSTTTSMTSSPLQNERPVDEGGIIQFGDHIILNMNDGSWVKSLKIGIAPLYVNKKEINIDALIGSEYGALWEVKNNVLMSVPEDAAPVRLVDDIEDYDDLADELLK